MRPEAAVAHQERGIFPIKGKQRDGCVRRDVREPDRVVELRFGARLTLILLLQFGNVLAKDGADSLFINADISRSLLKSLYGGDSFCNNPR